MRRIKLVMAALLLTGCSFGVEEGRGATSTTEAQLPASPQLYDDDEFEEASKEIARYDAAEKKSEKAATKKTAESK